MKDQNEELRIKDGMKTGLPIVIGYLPIALAFGILAKTVGVTFYENILFSILVFAGASQFMALNLLGVGVGIGQIVLTTLLVNLRHFLMSASLSAKLPQDMKKLLPIIAFGVTDETFSVISFKEGKLTQGFILSLQAMAYLSWVTGTALGYLVGNVLPPVVKSSMGIALYAMFIAILVPEMKRSSKILVLALSSGILNTLLNYHKIFPQGWNLVGAIVVISTLGAIIFKETEVDAYE